MSKNKYIESPEKLIELFADYCKYTKDNPIKKQDFVGKDADEVQRKLEKPLSWVGFECYLYDQGIIGDLSSYEQNRDESYTNYLPIITRIKKYINHDQFTGATVGIYQQNIIARSLGLVEKTNSELTGKDGGAIETNSTVTINVKRNRDSE